MSCFLFNLHLDDIMRWIDGNERLFADDIGIVFLEQNLSSMEEIISELEVRLGKLNMNLGKNKCKIWPKNSKSELLCEKLNS